MIWYNKHVITMIWVNAPLARPTQPSACGIRLCRPGPQNLCLGYYSEIMYACRSILLNPNTWMCVLECFFSWFYLLPWLSDLSITILSRPLLWLLRNYTCQPQNIVHGNYFSWKQDKLASQYFTWLLVNLCTICTYVLECVFWWFKGIVHLNIIFSYMKVNKICNLDQSPCILKLFMLVFCYIYIRTFCILYYHSHGWLHIEKNCLNLLKMAAWKALCTIL